MSDQDKIWQYFQARPEYFAGGLARQRALLAGIPKGSKVLNIGVGSGALERLAKAAGIHIHSLDPNEDTIQKLRKDLGLFDECKVGYADRLPFEDDSFEFVIMSEVLEHLDDEVMCSSIREARRVLLPAGRFIGTVPARERIERNMVVCPDCAKVFHRWGHKRRFEREDLRQVLAACFDRVVISERIFPAWDQLNIKGKIGAFLKIILLQVGVHGEYESFHFEASGTTSEAS